ncbi:hypothetical protein [Burkholderia territorii]|uniref:hypothetical protein n=1 Tax=Burkholderia territorii TaxID=1503055 RepID=UPI000753C99F|nr:hypothetical protein [Burkholderia territorii]KWE32627.1 hypothetical protein WT49_19675 [Burkholderia territorii]KWE46774.1 hypothetical protein WT50_00395 [Burkholderia territorii]KWE51205.1 hypothetical protein WT51_12660 [Burkholderia territorii]
MKLNPTPNAQSLYRDHFPLTADEINRIAIGTQVCVPMAPKDGQHRPPRQRPQDAATIPCAARTPLRLLD